MGEVHDPFFGPPYIDEDTWRDDPIHHRYVHGGFSGTDTRFAFYFPDKQYYRGRFIHMLEGGLGGHETHEGGITDFGGGRRGTKAYLEWAASLGGYFVESNQGHIGADPGPPNPTITTYRASAESARYARQLATEMYGQTPRHGYLFGGSGGGIRSLLCMENIGDVWSAAVPFVGGDPEAQPGLKGPHPMALVGLLGPKLAQIKDAIAPGGSGNPCTGLDLIERELLAATLTAGFEERAFLQFGRSGLEMILPQIVPIAVDPCFVEHFWAKPGHEGADGKLKNNLIEKQLVVREVLTPEEFQKAGVKETDAAMIPMMADHFGYKWVGIRVDGDFPPRAETCNLRIETGKAAGKELTCCGVYSGIAIVGGPKEMLAEALAPGDKATIDNRRLLAVCFKHRYPQTPGIEEARSVFMALPMSGKFDGKIILLDATLDSIGGTAIATHYDKKVRANYGTKADDRWRLWWADNSGHGGNMDLGPPGSPPTLQSMLVDYAGMLHKAVESLIGWVERDVPPAASTGFQIKDGQLVLAPTAAERQGLQPVVTATVNGSVSADTRVGTNVTFEVTAEATPRGGTIRSVAWDFDGSGKFIHKFDEVDGRSRSVKLTRTYHFDAPGTYFPSVRVQASEKPDTGPVSLSYDNVARVRVVVS